ncbi:putative RING-H2 finger protein ATL21A [Solanum stenotomum]|uniref:putative RING-H2 finger protein ATL21A n=1 Tax=Solanum stenotomum TaxID=172797 RepID=UPI0020CFF2D4|nr:putative RING-H2 finger protein ATL21A [Solanum stenotomum]
MDILKFISFSFLLCLTVYAGYDCPDSICGNNHFDIRFPFGIEGRQNLQNCSYPGFSLICSDQGRSILSLPGAGDYYVRDIDYGTQEIQLHDPSDCLPKRLMNFSTSFSSSSPFKAVAYRNYTFLTCSTNSVLSRLNVISCLSNSTTSTLATTSPSVASQMISLYSCSIINSSSVPASWAFQYQSDFLTDLITDLVLTWDEPNCQECEVNQGVCGFKNAIIREIQCFDSPGTGNKRPVQQVLKFIAITLLIPGITCLIGVSCYFCLEYSRSSRASGSIQSITTRTTVAPQPATGLDDSTIESYTKVVLGESGRVPGPNHGSCPICLAEYHPKEIVKCIPECEHCFHAECIDEWLKINGSCPVCRNNPSPARVTSLLLSA